MKDMKIHHQIECKEIEIECPEMDCKYRTSRTTILSHVIDCEFRFIKCNIDKCKKSGPYKYMKEHLNICSVWRCNICKMEFPSTQIKMHDITCIKKIVKCPVCSEEMTIGIFEKHFNLETSYIRYYTLMINCVKNNIPEGALYLIEKYKTDNIPESALSILIQEILKSENIHLMRYFNVSSILNSQQFIIDICNDLSFQSSTDAILYIIDNIYLEESTKILILKQF